MVTINDTAAVILANAAGRPDLRVLPLPKGLKVQGAASNRVLEKLVRTRLLATIAATRDDVAWAEDEEIGRMTLIVTDAGLAAIGIETEGAAEAPCKRGTAAALKPETDSSTSTSIKRTPKPRVAASRAKPAQKGAPRVLAKNGAHAPGKKAATRRHVPATSAKPGKGVAKTDKPVKGTTKAGKSANPDTSATRAASKAPSPRTAEKGLTKQQVLVGMLRRPNGASIDELVKATGWQPHSVRGVLTATVKGRLALPVISEKGEDGVRRYFIAPISTGRGRSS